MKSDDAVLNLSLLSLLLDFGLYGTYADCLNLPFLHSLKRKNTRELQVCGCIFMFVQFFVFLILILFFLGGGFKYDW